MKIKGKSEIEYSIKGKKESIIIKVELKMTEECNIPRKNIYYGIATMNDKEYDDPNLKYCVDAQVYADYILDKEINLLREKYGKALRIKKK